MPNTPVMSLRVPVKHQKLVRRAARALRDDPGMAARITAIMAGKQLPTPCEPALGPFRDQDSALDFIRDRLVAAVKPDEIWLFGSRARGHHRPDSDFDILVVLPDDALLDHAQVFAPIMASGLSCDVVPCHRSDFITEQNQPGSISARAVAEGRAIYRKRALRGVGR